MSTRLARAFFALAFVLVAAVVASCSGGSSNSTAPAPVPGPNFSFAFPTTGSLATPGTSNKRIFTAAEVGTWGYHCIPHQSAGMTGTVVVDAAATADSALVGVGANNAFQFAQITNGAFGSSTVTIKPGGYVRWVNVSNMNTHTVTR